MRVYKQFYMIFVLLRACLWNVGSSFARDGHADVPANQVSKGDKINGKVILVAYREVLYTADISTTENDDFLRTQVSHIAALPVFHRDIVYNKRIINGERARFLRLLLFPNHSFG